MTQTAKHPSIYETPEERARKYGTDVEAEREADQDECDRAIAKAERK